jgi:hypothetical protein
MNTITQTRFAFAAAFAIVAFSACSHHKVQFDADAPTASTTKNMNDGFTARLNWYKSKRSAIDSQITLTNHYSFPIDFNNNNLKMRLNNADGKINFSKFSGHLAPGATETALISFEFAGLENTYGAATLTIDGFLGTDGKKVAPLVLQFQSAKQ